ncbi:hypothetical protein ES332_A09G141800v1 [Gossypium tomentosum]|uniref:Uncharacterized protein n=1 Tax=Gossypium tomentosum TaxID=34277 RepID=A0A5D2P502_GOSTO|nr:hypothetical protein ES332_A09G141800v1 [Gossypium tomentosum]TYI10445.1 hypothetical protein ES332_A09G141800v1 [Gossypium tomentosum]
MILYFLILRFYFSSCVILLCMNGYASTPCILALCLCSMHPCFQSAQISAAIEKEKEVHKTLKIYNVDGAACGLVAGVIAKKYMGTLDLQGSLI